MTYEEAAQIMMSGTGEGGKAKEKTITENGRYTITDTEKSEGYVGYSPVNVNVPDRYDEGFAEGFADGVKSVAISPLTVTANGTYHAADYGCDGFDPVNVNVPDRYNEGYEEGQKHGKYTFPDDTPYEDIVNIVGGDNVADETLGVQIKTTTWYDENGTYHTQTKVYDLLGNELSGLWGQEIASSFIEAWGEPIVTYCAVTDSTTGAWKIVYTYPDGDTSERTGTNSYLIGFGEDGHTYSVSNKG